MTGQVGQAVQFGQYRPAGHTVVHLSDTHLLASRGALHGRVDTDTPLEGALARLEASGIRPDALVFTGDIADRGETDAYRRLRTTVEPVAARLGAELVWVMGNHDERVAFRRDLLGHVNGAPDRSPVDTVTTVRGLRIIALDTSVPGYHHGALDDAQLDWLRAVLAEPAVHGSLLALHHPPVPTPLRAMQILELERQEALAEVVAGSDIRAILGGHLHYATTSLFAGIPVSVAAASCYTMDLLAPGDELVGVDGGQGLNLVHVYEDRVVHSVVPFGDAPRVTHFDAAFLARMDTLTAEQRREAFSRHLPPDDEPTGSGRG